MISCGSLWVAVKQRNIDQSGDQPNFEVCEACSEYVGQPSVIPPLTDPDGGGATFSEPTPAEVADTSPA